MSTRLIILADVHLAFGPHSPGATDTSYAQRLLREAVEKILSLRPDRVMLLGDILNTGSAEEYEQAKQILAPLMDRIEPLLGNHELLTGTLDQWRQFWRVPPFRQTIFGDLPAILLSSGIEGLPVTQWNGRLDETQLKFLAEVLAAKSASPLLVFCHHPLANTVRRSDKPMMGLDNSPELERRLSQHPREVVLFSGHAHYQSIAHQSRLTCVGAPSLCFWPHAFLVADIDSLSVQLKTVRLFDDPAHSPDPKASDPAYRALAEGQKSDQFGTLLLD